MKEINYPSVKTFFIANNGVNYSYGVIETDQCMTTGLENIEVFEDEQSYLLKLSEYGLLCIDENKELE